MPQIKMPSGLLDFLWGIGTGVVITIGAIAILSDDAPRTEITVPNRLEPYGLYIKVNPGGINDTTYTYDISPYLK